MNCPACGAPNEADTQFCAQCGSPLENDEIEATIAGQKFLVDSEPVDPTVPEPATAPEADSSSDLTVAAETIMVDQIPPPAGLPESDDQPDEPLPSSTENEPVTPKSPETAEALAEPPPNETPAGANGAGDRKIRFIVGGVALFLIIICCCCSVFVGAMFGILTSEAGQEILRELGAISLNWPVV